MRAIRFLFPFIVTPLLLLLFAACSNNDSSEATIKNTYNGNFNTYYEMSDNTWRCGDNTYMYKIELTGRMPSAVKDSRFVYLSNIENISFEQAYKAAGISSNSNDYFDAKDAILVEIE